MKQMINGQLVDMTENEIEEYNARNKVFQDNIPTVKLKIIRDLRNQKLSETDYLALSDNTLSVAISNYRQGLRDIPQNNTTEEQYDLILSRVDGELTNEVWSKP